jgi:hypothetical protein
MIKKKQQLIINLNNNYDQNTAFLLAKGINVKLSYWYIDL